MLEPEFGHQGSVNTQQTTFVETTTQNSVDSAVFSNIGNIAALTPEGVECRHTGCHSGNSHAADHDTSRPDNAEATMSLAHSCFCIIRSVGVIVCSMAGSAGWANSCAIWRGYKGTHMKVQVSTHTYML